MSLLLRINLALGTVFLVAGLIAAVACWSILESNARREASGIQCWIAPRDIAPSADWAAEIIDAIAAA